jgi:UDP-N-acetylglucosamine transferase subunit ALG13
VESTADGVAPPSPVSESFPDDSNGAADIPLVFVTVGTDLHPFDRIVDWVDSWLDGRTPAVRVVVQYGTSKAPRLAEGVVSLPYDEMRRMMAEAAVVVCHGGPGTIMEARRLGQEPVVVPRRHDLGEHVDNHQMHFARKLAANDGLRLVEDFDDFTYFVTAGAADPTLLRIPPRPALGPGVDGFERELSRLGPRPPLRTRLHRQSRTTHAIAAMRPRISPLADGDNPSVAEPGRPPVLFIAGWGRSGSTLLDRTLGSVPGVVSTGELRDIWTRGLLENRLCGCGVPFRECPFWTEVGDRGFGGWENLDIERLRVLRARVDRPWTLPMLVWPVLPSFRRARNEYAATLDTLLDAIASVSEARLVVESTKIATFAVLLRVTGRQVNVLHMVRDSRGVMHSWNKIVERGDSSGTGEVFDVPGAKAGETMVRYGAVSGSLRYVVYNLMAESLGKLPGARMPIRRQRYEDFVADPAATRASILRFAGLEAPAEVAAGTGQVSLLTCHTVDGNPSRQTASSVTVRLDDGWRTAMPQRARRVVTAVTGPLLRRYGYPLRSGVPQQRPGAGGPS